MAAVPLQTVPRKGGVCINATSIPKARFSCVTRLTLKHQSLGSHIRCCGSINSPADHEKGLHFLEASDEVPGSVKPLHLQGVSRFGSSFVNGAIFSEVNHRDVGDGQLETLFADNLAVKSKENNARQSGRMKSRNSKSRRKWLEMTHEEFVNEVAALNPTGCTRFSTIMPRDEFAEFCQRRGKAFSKVLTDISIVCEDVDLVKKLRRIRVKTDLGTVENVGSQTLKPHDAQT